MQQSRPSGKARRATHSKHDIRLPLHKTVVEKGCAPCREIKTFFSRCTLYMRARRNRNRRQHSPGSFAPCRLLFSTAIIQHDNRFFSYTCRPPRTCIPRYARPGPVVDQGQSSLCWTILTPARFMLPPFPEPEGWACWREYWRHGRLLPLSPPLIIWLPVIVLASVSFADDIYDLPVWVRLLMHSVFAAWFSVALLTDTNGWLVAAFAALAVTWMLNLYNFMDGSDGMAGGMTLIGFGCYGVAAWLAGMRHLRRQTSVLPHPQQLFYCSISIPREFFWAIQAPFH